MLSRRDIIKGLTALPAFLSLQSFLSCSDRDETLIDVPQSGSTIFKATHENPAVATRRLLAALGGIESIIGRDDIVILKPNCQWWHQGMTNTDVMAEFIENIINIPKFAGEIIIADSHQAKTLNDRAWTTDKRNGQFNYNELIAHFNNRGFANVTKYHWNPAGPNPTPLQMDGSGDAVIGHASEGDGYIWPKDLYYECPHGNRSILAYPVFTSSYSGVTIDLKEGAFQNGKYTKQPVKFINFSAINHHSRYAGVTASIKNYMGVVDMSCGYPAPTPEGMYNTHHVGASWMFRWLVSNGKRVSDLPYFWDVYLHPSVFRFRYTGALLGRYMTQVRRADLNIITAVRVGWGSRIDLDKSAFTDTIVASTDPVALDYWTAANVLLPATIAAGAPDELVRLNNPAIENGSFRRFLEECRAEAGGTTDPDLIELVEA